MCELHTLIIKILPKIIMLKDPLLKHIIIIATIIFLSGILVFAIVAYWMYSLLIGWVIGSSFSIGIFWLKGWVMKNFLSLNTTKQKAFLASMFHTFGYFVIFAACLISILAINFAAVGKNLFTDSVEHTIAVVNSPISIFSFIVGIHTIMASIFISHFERRRKENKGQNKKGKLSANI